MKVARDGVERFRGTWNLQVTDYTKNTKDRKDTQKTDFVCDLCANFPLYDMCRVFPFTEKKADKFAESTRLENFERNRDFHHLTWHLLKIENRNAGKLFEGRSPAGQIAT